MNTDEKIRDELEAGLQIPASYENGSQGMFAIVASAYRGSLGRWLVLISIIALGVTSFMLWAAYAFFTATNIDERVIWGVMFIIALIIQVSLKLWTWMEMNRNSVIREIKRLELALERVQS